MNIPADLQAFIEDALPKILPAIPCDDYSHEDDVLFGAVLGILYARGWQELNVEEEIIFIDISRTCCR